MRCIVRRPHAYAFLEETFADEGGIASATPAGCRTPKGRTLPLPGFYVLEADGRWLGACALRSKEELVEFLRAPLPEVRESAQGETARASIRVSGFIEAEGIT